MIKILLSILLLVPFGQDYLGGAKFQGAILNNHDFSQGAGLFATTFGDALPIATQLARGGVPFLRIQLGWKDDHNFKESDFAGLVAQAKRFCPLSNLTKLYLSGACEHNLNAALANKLASQVLAACPSATYVNVPWRGAVLPQYINETHGNGGPKSKRSSYSSDGSPSEDIDIEPLKSKFTEFFMFWSPRYNGRWEDNDSTPRPNRTGYADGKMIKSMLALAKPKGATSLPKNWIYKSHSENKGKGDPRSEKPVIIAPIRDSILKVGDVSCPRYKDPYQDGRSRYYCPKWGYEIGTSPVKIGKYGTINPAFRDGSYR